MFSTVLRRVLWFTALGWLTLLLIGPVMAVAGTLLPFALIGGLVWLVWWGAERATRHARLAYANGKWPQEPVVPALGRGARHVFEQGVHHCKAFAPVVRDRAKMMGCGAGRAMREGMNHCQAAVPVLREGGCRVRRKMGSFVRATTRLLFEVGCGALVGGLVGYSAFDANERMIAYAALVGGAIGFVVGGPKRRPPQENA